MDAPWRVRLVATIATIALLGAPAGAHAHLRSGIVATDYRATVTRIPPATVVRVRVYPSDRALGLTVEPGNVVSVLSPSGASLLRVDDRRAS
jgi:hypothetical protein